MLKPKQQSLLVFSFNYQVEFSSSLYFAKGVVFWEYSFLCVMILIPTPPSYKGPRPCLLQEDIIRAS